MKVVRVGRNIGENISDSISNSMRRRFRSRRRTSSDGDVYFAISHRGVIAIGNDNLSGNKSPFIRLLCIWHFLLWQETRDRVCTLTESSREISIRRDRHKSSPKLDDETSCLQHATRATINNWKEAARHNARITRGFFGNRSIDG